ncbi:hypothetical protein HPB52_025707 [Rhipicephalus sanguineus]|uniref:Uncharacterized protein n=1 Tax=Rhipicephalus sanguineus TaxID=34632 RepID=A0A9D4SLW9_RHISA|nr:hypothetical protein HPB52_025707 [Rhipicephalus sanguineus]
MGISNILSTPHQEVAAKARGIELLTVNGHTHAVKVYAAAAEEAIEVVYGIPQHIPAETLLANLRVCTHGVELIQARMIGDTKSATLTFRGPILPKVVYYYGGELVCHPFRASVQVCKLCRVRGHRMDFCIHADRRICRMCGLENPSPEHPCELNCASGYKSLEYRVRLDRKQPDSQIGFLPITRKKPAGEPQQIPVEILLQIGAALSSNPCPRVIDTYAEVCPNTASAEEEGDACPPPWFGDFEHSYARGQPGGGRVCHDQP